MVIKKKTNFIAILFITSISITPAYAQLPIPNTIILPTPHTSQIQQTLEFSLHDAIILALRYNPDVISTDLNRLEQRFALKVAQNELMPQFTLSGSASSSSGNSPTASVTPDLKLTTPFGPTFNISYKHSFDGQRHSPTASITQSLNQLGLPKLNFQSAQDNEVGNQIAYLDAISGYVINVITAYRTLVSDKNQLLVQEKNFKQSSKQLEDDRLRVKAGTIAPNDLLQSESTLAANKLDIIQSRFNYQESKQKFLQTLGLDPNTPFEINYNISKEKGLAPDKKKTLATAFKHNPTYLTALLSLRQAKRNLKMTKISTRPNLSITANSDSTASANISMPLRRLSTQQQRLQSRIALKNAENMLERARQQVIFDINNQIEQIRSQIETIKQAEHSVTLAKKNYDMGVLQKKYGKISQQSLDQLQNELLEQRINLISYRIDYLNQQSSLRRYCGQTLEHWNIHLRSEREIKKILS